MANNVAITAGSGTPIETMDIGAGVERQVVTIGPRDLSTNDSIGALTETAPASDTASSGLNGRLQRIAQRLTTALTGIALAASTAVIGTVKTRVFAVAASGAITRPANVTAYTAGDAVSNNATAGSVTSPTFTVSDTNDDPIALTRLRLDTTDTGTKGQTFQAFFYFSDPTASTGIVGGDNAVFSVKKAGFIGTMTGTFRSDFSDGAQAILTPDEGSVIITKPGSGAQTVWYILKTLSAFTPSANSTTFTGTLEGYQHRA